MTGSRGKEGAGSWRCLVKFGHQGTGRYLEKVVVVKAPNIVQAMQKARYYPGVKSHLRDCVLQVEPVKQPGESLDSCQRGAESLVL